MLPAMRHIHPPFGALIIPIILLFSLFSDSLTAAPFTYQLHDGFCYARNGYWTLRVPVNTNGVTSHEDVEATLQFRRLIEPAYGPWFLARPNDGNVRRLDLSNQVLTYRFDLYYRTMSGAHNMTTVDLKVPVPHSTYRTPPPEIDASPIVRSFLQHRTGPLSWQSNFEDSAVLSWWPKPQNCVGLGQTCASNQASANLWMFAPLMLDNNFKEAFDKLQDCAKEGAFLQTEGWTNLPLNYR